MKAAVNRRAAQLAKLAIKLNSDDFTVFCRYSGHVKTIEIDVHIGGWKEGANVDWNRWINLTSPHSLEHLEQAIVRLQAIKSSGHI